MKEFYNQMTRQLEAMPDGAKLEWHFQEKIVADEVRKRLPHTFGDRVKIFYTPAP